MKLALYQGAGVSARPGENRAIMARVAGECAALGCGLVVFPELFASGYNIGDEVLDLAERVDGDTAKALSMAASDNGIAILAGYPERAGDRVYNAAMLVGPDGALLANARKSHLFGSEEQRLFAPGESLTLARLGDLSIGILICYDVEFPEAVRALALDGAALVAVPTALMRPHDRVAEKVVPIRAFENQVFVAYANRCGREGALDYCGASCIVGPDGGELARAGQGETLLTAEVDPVAYEHSRRDNPYLTDRRPGLYRRLVDTSPTDGDEA
jgi:5-aminopentanamidase